jgi:hypothetical protein
LEAGEYPEAGGSGSGSGKGGANPNLTLVAVTDVFGNSPSRGKVKSMTGLEGGMTGLEGDFGGAEAVAMVVSQVYSERGLVFDLQRSCGLANSSGA